MRHWFTAALTATLMAGFTLALVPTDAEAKRAGGAKSSGMQRQTPDKPVQKAPADTSTATPPSGAAAAAPAAAAAAKAAPAAAARSKWMGPLMGLAAGLGLAALFSSLGMGETFSSIVMIMLLAMVGFAAFRFFMSRRAKANGASGASPFAMAGAAAGTGAAASSAATQTMPSSMARTASDDARGVQIGSALTPPLSVPGLNDGASNVGASAADTAPAGRFLPADFDTQAFERIAKTIFVRLQAANDDRNLDDLRAFTTPEMFAELRTDLMERGTAEQKTDVVSVNATVLDFAEEGTQQIISVRYVGVIREEASAPATSFDEVWHLVKEREGGPAWRIAGIQQMG
jgi:predicted lipid-binding transport protein (Tim44 family)